MNIKLNKGKNKKIYVLIAMVIILFLTLVFMFIGLQRAVKEQKSSFEKGVQLQGELGVLMDDYTSAKIENEDLSSQLVERDSVIMSNATEIKKLIARQADYNKIKKKLRLLRNITQDYVKRIDSLVIVNTELNEENVIIKKQIDVQLAKAHELESDKKDLAEKVSVASAFKAYNLIVKTVRLRGDGIEIATDKSRRIDRVKIDFTLSENKIVEAGVKTIYARISRPDGIVLTLGEGGEYSFMLGDKQLQYSIKEEIDYKNQAIGINMVWNKTNSSDAAMEGKYDVMLYMGDVEIGRASFIIRP